MTSEKASGLIKLSTQNSVTDLDIGKSCQDLSKLRGSNDWFFEGDKLGIVKVLDGNGKVIASRPQLFKCYAV